MKHIIITGCNLCPYKTTCWSGRIAPEDPDVIADFCQLEDYTEDKNRVNTLTVQGR